MSLNEAIEELRLKRQNMDRRLPSWISLNDNLAVKNSISSSSISNRSIIDEEVVLASRSVGRGGRNLANYSSRHANLSPRNKPKQNKRSLRAHPGEIKEEIGERMTFDSCKNFEGTKADCFELNKSDANIGIDNNTSFRMRLAEISRHRNCYDYSQPDWKIIRDFISKATHDEIAAHLFEETSFEQQSDACQLSSKNDIESQVLYGPTILGFLCQLNMAQPCYLSSDEIQAEKDCIVETFRTIVHLCPDQVYCNQCYRGHTPLRDAACNPTILPEVVELMISSVPASRFQQLVKVSDLNNLTLIDHVVRVIQMDDIGGSNNRLDNSLPVLRTILKYTDATMLSCSAMTSTAHENVPDTSPLIRLLSLGTSFGCSYVLSDGDSGISSVSLPEIESPTGSASDTWDGTPTNASPCSKRKQKKKILLYTTTSSPKNEGNNRDGRKLNRERSQENRPDSKTLDICRLNRILKCIQMLLDWDPMLLYRKSSMTNCSVLHVAIRNYGNYKPIIDELLLRNCRSFETKRSEILDQTSHRFWLLHHRNRFGDLPIHVACSVGVPMNVLETILNESTFSGRQGKHYKGNSIVGINSSHVSYRVPHSALWSCNYSGYTPIDLEWIRHIEVGCYFHTHRAFYPLDSQGIMQQRHNDGNNSRYEDMYGKLLRQAVDQAIKLHEQELPTTQSQNQGEDNSSGKLGFKQFLTEHHPCKEQVQSLSSGNEAVGLLLQRICLLIRSAFESRSQLSLLSAKAHDRDVKKHHDGSDYVLHLACALSSPFNGPVLPLPLLELFLWMYPEQLSQRAPMDNTLPLHLALRRWKTPASKYGTTDGDESCIRCVSVSEKARAEWTSWIQKLIKKWPDAISCMDGDGRLPIHHALDWTYDPRNAPDSENTLMEEDMATNEIIIDLVHEYPHSLEVVDPKTNFCPFLQAAANPLITLNTAYLLLRKSPSRIVS